MDNSIPKTVLVVEDVSEIGSQFETMLQRRGHRTLIASNASEAIRLAEAARPSLILTDLDLPTFELLIKGIRVHATLNDLVVAIIDIDGPILDAPTGVKVVNDFNELDQLLASTVN